MSDHARPPGRLHTLDALRGVAALAVVLWHWNHFFHDGTTLVSFEPSHMPFYRWLSIFYDRGYLAVDLFFCLSGFIFYWLYAHRIHGKAISAGKFLYLRFTRLYPLHAVTLLAVVLGQFIYHGMTGTAFVYEHNDLKHFFLNVFFVSSWGFKGFLSFNGPIWSVSVEVLLYCLFFVLTRFLPVRVSLMFIVSCLGYAVVYPHNPEIGRGIGSFFLGGIIYFVSERIRTFRNIVPVTYSVTFVAVALWLLTLYIFYGDINMAAFLQQMVPGHLHLEGKLQWVFAKAVSRWPILVLFPMTILSLALLEARGGAYWQRLAGLGDISYSVYLLHFPLQLYVAIVFGTFTLSRDIYATPLFMFSFYVVLVVLGLVSYRFLERPAQKYLRDKGQHVFI
ncbi:MAG: acyltransferase [Verrucomicrobia bacterium]|nr:acyltransferase [Verrucomicrobiota bacterium]